MRTSATDDWMLICMACVLWLTAAAPYDADPATAQKGAVYIHTSFDGFSWVLAQKLYGFSGQTAGVYGTAVAVSSVAQGSRERH